MSNGSTPLTTLQTRLQGAMPRLLVLPISVMIVETFPEQCAAAQISAAIGDEQKFGHGLEHAATQHAGDVAAIARSGFNARQICGGAIAHSHSCP